MTPGQIGTWKVERSELQVRNALNTRYRFILAVAQDASGASAPLLELRKAIHEIGESGRGWSKHMPFEHGVPILWEERLKQPATEFVYTEEVVSIEEREGTPSTYEVPADYAKEKGECRVMP